MGPSLSDGLVIHCDMLPVTGFVHHIIRAIHIVLAFIFFAALHS